MRSGESFAFGPIDTASAQFQLDGGKYWFSGVGTFNGATLALQRLQGDGELLTVGTALTVNGSNNIDLPSGTYQFSFTVAGTNPAVYVEVVRINEE